MSAVNLFSINKRLRSLTQQISKRFWTSGITSKRFLRTNLKESCLEDIYQRPVGLNHARNRLPQVIDLWGKWFLRHSLAASLFASNIVG